MNTTERETLTRIVNLASFIVKQSDSHVDATRTAMEIFDEASRALDAEAGRTAWKGKVTDLIDCAPTEDSGSAGSLKATQEHLEDMRGIAKHLLEMK